MKTKHEIKLNLLDKALFNRVEKLANLLYTDKEVIITALLSTFAKEPVFKEGLLETLEKAEKFYSKIGK